MINFPAPAFCMPYGSLREQPSSGKCSQHSLDDIRNTDLVPSCNTKGTGPVLPKLQQME